MSKHIGIVACSAEGAALCYRTICSEAATLLGRNAHLEVSLHTHSSTTYIDRLSQNDVVGVADLMLSSARKLESIGAELLICPHSAMHVAFRLVEDNSIVPWLHIADVVTEQAQVCGFQKVGVLGTRVLLQSDVYPQKLRAAGIEFMLPGEDDIAEIDRITFEELINGVFYTASVTWLCNVIKRLAEGGCDAVVLGGAELPLVLSDLNSVLPTLDPTRLLARAALRAALD